MIPRKSIISTVIENIREEQSIRHQMKKEKNSETKISHIFQRSHTVDLRRNNLYHTKSSNSINNPQLIAQIANSFQESKRKNSTSSIQEDDSFRSNSSVFNSSETVGKKVEVSQKLIKKLLTREHKIYKTVKSHKNIQLHKHFTNKNVDYYIKVSEENANARNFNKNKVKRIE